MALSFTRKVNMSPGQRDTGDVIDAGDVNELQEALEDISLGTVPIPLAGIASALQSGGYTNGAGQITTAAITPALEEAYDDPSSVLGSLRASADGIQDGTLPIALAGIEAALGQYEPLANAVTRVFDVRDYGAACDGTTDDRVALLAALSAADTADSGAGGTVYVAGSLAFSGVVNIPKGVNLQGAGSGKQNLWGTRFKCLSADAQLVFGNQATGYYGGPHGGFTVDGNNIATDPIVFGISAGMAIGEMYVISAAAGGAAVCLQGTQNMSWRGLRIEDCAGDGLVFDLGAGGNNFFGTGIADCAGHAVKFVQTGSSPLVYPEPSDNRFFGYMIESYEGVPNGLVYHGAGVGNSFTGGAFSLDQIAAKKPIVTLTKDGSENSSLLKFHDGLWFGSMTDDSIGIDVGAGCTAVVTGSHRSYYLNPMFNVHNGGIVNEDGLWTRSTTTWFASPDGATLNSVRSNRVSRAVVTCAVSTDAAFQSAASDTGEWMSITGRGNFNWNNEASLYHRAGNSVGMWGQFVPDGGVTTKKKAGVPVDGDVPEALDGTMVLDTTNNRLYVRSGGTWKYASLT